MGGRLLLLLILLLLPRGERVRRAERDFAEVDTDRQILLDGVVQQAGDGDETNGDKYKKRKNDIIVIGE